MLSAQCSSIMVLIQFTPFIGSDGTTEQLLCGDELG